MSDKGLRLLCVTWNAKGAKPEVNNVLKMLKGNQEKNDGPRTDFPDIIAFTVQETLEMKLKPILKAQFDNRKPKLWKKTMQAVFASQPFKDQDYYEVKSQSLLGLFITVYAKTCYRGCIIKANIGKSVANTVVGNKGGVAVRFDFWDRHEDRYKSFCFVGVHLTSKEGTDKAKNADIGVITRFIKWKKDRMNFAKRASSILSMSTKMKKRPERESSGRGLELAMNGGLAPMKSNARKGKVTVTMKDGRRKTRFETRTGAAKNSINSQFSTRVSDNDLFEEVETYEEASITMLEHDFVIVFGDLNYRLEDVKLDDILDAIEAGGEQLTKLEEKYDHLKKNIAEGKALKSFCEGPKSFPPTYKYVVGSCDYVTKRKPSWTDRILYKTSEEFNNVEVIDYFSVQDIDVSDHKPVIKEMVLN